MQNRAIAAMFNDIADMLEIKDESPFRITAYRRAARALEGLTEDVAAIAARGGLGEIPGIGKGTAEKIQEFLRTGTSAYYEDLRASLPPGITTLMSVPDVGPKTAMLLYERLGIKTIDELEQACKAGKVRTLPRMGERTEQNILNGIALLRRTKERLPIGQVLPHAQELVATLRGVKQVTQASVAGSLRRMKESIGDIDILVTSTTPEPVMDVFTTFGKVKQVLAKGPTRSSVVLDAGIQADVRVVEPESFGAALQYFTGSKDHNVKLREKAVKKGLKINEYGVFTVQDDRRIAGRTEEEVYAAIGLPWIPPEIREDQGEIELAERGRLPTLIELKDIRGDLQMHTRWSDGSDSIDEMARAAKANGYEYIAITDHSQSLKFVGGVTVEELRELDVVVCSVHTRLRMPRQEMTARIVKAMENRHVDILGHPTGRLLGQREAYEVDLEQLIDAAIRTGTALEINGSPQRLDLNDVQAKTAKERGAKLVISTDAHNRYQLKYMEFGVGIARRAWIEAKDVMNTRPLAQLRAWLHER